MTTEIATTTRPYVGADQSEVDARQAATKLRNLLRMNSEFSLVTGLVGVVAASPIADFLDIDQTWLVRLVAAGLLYFSLDLFVVAGSKTKTLRLRSLDMSLSDFAWVAATVVVIAMGWLSTGGSVLMGLLAVPVLELGIAQFRARRRLIKAMASTPSELAEFPPVEIVRVELTSKHSAASLWPIISDHSLYGELASNLTEVKSLTPNGPGLERTCTDKAGRSWFESCTLWEEGRRYDLNVDTSDYPYPLQVMQGSWQVDPTPDGAVSLIGMTFAFQPTAGLRGRIFVPMMHLLFRPALNRIAKGWDKAAAAG